MQEPKTDKDEEYTTKVNNLLNNPPTPGSSGGGGVLPPGLTEQLGRCLFYFHFYPILCNTTLYLHCTALLIIVIYQVIKPWLFKVASLTVRWTSFNPILRYKLLGQYLWLQCKEISTLGIMFLKMSWQEVRLNPPTCTYSFYPSHKTAPVSLKMRIWSPQDESLVSADRSFVFLLLKRGN